MKYVGAYEGYFVWIDRLTRDTLAFAPPAGVGNDDFRSDLAGFLATAYVASFESSIRSLFLAFARSKHRTLATVTEFHFDRLSGNIGIDSIADKYTKQFGEKYRKEFKRRIQIAEDIELSRSGQSLKQSYRNLIFWRNKFAHEGEKLATLDEVIDAETHGRMIIRTLDDTLSSRLR